ncbi:MAG: hypothetical protein ACJAST_003085, partial [Halopseudomonas sp.]
EFTPCKSGGKNYWEINGLNPLSGESRPLMFWEPEYPCALIEHVVTVFQRH